MAAKATPKQVSAPGAERPNQAKAEPKPLHPAVALALVNRARSARKR